MLGKWNPSSVSYANDGKDELFHVAYVLKKWFANIHIL